MAKYNRYLKRLRAATERRKEQLPERFITMLQKRMPTDRELDTVMQAMIKAIEPTPCKVSHCPHFTAYSFCNCAEQLLPSKCRVSISYHLKKNKRETGIKSAIVSEIIALYHISQEDAENAFKKLLQQSSNSYKFVTGTWEKYKKENQPKK